MLMNPPPTFGASPLYSPASINRQTIQPQGIPGMQSNPVLGPGTTGLGAPGINSGMPQIGGGTGKSTGTGQMNTPSLVNLLGRG